MKTKLLFKTIFFIFFVQSIYSQNYIPFLNNSSWYVQVSTQMGPEYIWIEEGIDTVIGSFTYKKFIDVYGAEIYVREDITTKRVYRRINNSDVLMFDFNLQVGDSITLGNGNLYSVSSISNINVNGGQRRMFYLNNLSNPFFAGERWIEGVGNDNHPLRPFFELPSDPAYNIRCSYQDGISVYNFGLANGGIATTCPTTTMSIIKQNLNSQKVQIFPNPFSNETTLKFEIDVINCNLEMFDSIGQKVKEINNINTNEIILKKDNLVNGIYLLVLKQNGKILETQKIILQD
jgi:hypothetical protein